MIQRKTRRSKKSELLQAIPSGIQARARAAVGSSNISRLAWLLVLLNQCERIGKLDENERAELVAQVVAFSEPVGAVAAGRPSFLAPEALSELAQRIRADLLALREGATLEFQIPPLTFAFTPEGTSTFIGTAEALFLFAVAMLIEKEWERIRLCARSGCGNLFARRKRGLYCSAHCAQIEHLTRYVARHSG